MYGGEPVVLQGLHGVLNVLLQEPAELGQLQRRVRRVELTAVQQPQLTGGQSVLRRRGLICADWSAQLRRIITRLSSYDPVTARRSLILALTDTDNTSTPTVTDEDDNDKETPTPTLTG